jgi:hypothetical protein
VVKKMIRPLLMVVSLLLSSVSAQAQMKPLALVQAEVAPGAVFSSDGPLRVRVYSRDSVKLASTLGDLVDEVSEEHASQNNNDLTLTLDHYPQMDHPSGQWLDESFVVDYRDAAVVALNAAFAKAYGQNNLHEKLIQFVADTLEGSSLRGWDVASRVAHNKDGDCTEHAVLLVALARANGIPARIAIGLAITGDNSRFGAYGHAWAELKINGRWIVADAAMFDANVPVHYVPFGVLDDEGPGYSIAIMQLTPVWVQRVVVLGR